MPRNARVLLSVALLLVLPVTALAQQTDITLDRPPALSQILTPAPGPLTLSAQSPNRITSLINREASAPAAAAYQYSRPDWEFGRAWLGAAIGTGLGYTFDLIVHYESDFSKANPFLNEKSSGGEVTYNILLYTGLGSYYAMKGVHGVTPFAGNKWASFAGGAVGSLLGLAYWTERGVVQDASSILVTTGLTALGAQMAYHLFR